MYFIIALILTIFSALVWFVFKNKKKLHLEILFIIYGAATLMWLVDCFASLIEEGEFIDFADPMGGWISLLTFIGGIVLWIFILLILNSKKSLEYKEELQ